MSEFLAAVIFVLVFLALFYLVATGVISLLMLIVCIVILGIVGLFALMS